MALQNPERFVLKPQREGGGNNVYGKEVKARNIIDHLIIKFNKILALSQVGEVLEKLKNSSERAGYILMDVIQPPLLRNWMIRPGSKPMLIDTISELGIFGVIIG